MSGELNYFNYFTEIEDVFVRLRGKHVFISPLDWVLIDVWKSKGIPLYVVVRGIETAFASHAARAQKRAVKTLVYCQEEVEAQYAEWLESQVGAATGEEGAGGATEGATAPETPGSLPFPRAAIAEHLAGALTALRALAESPAGTDPALREALDRVTGRLEIIAGDFAAAAAPRAEPLEDNLTALESLLHAALLTHLPAGELAEARRAAEVQLKPYKSKMEAAIYEQTRNGLVLKQLLGQRDLPRLSLFYL
jgi:hypothetical protein